MTDAGPLTCCLCDEPATVSYGLIPKRANPPLCDHTKRATVWPGVSLATIVRACANRQHQEQCKRAGSVIAEHRLGEGSVTRMVKD